MSRGRSKAFLKKLRKKHGLGEFRKKRARRRAKDPGAVAADRREGRQRVARRRRATKKSQALKRRYGQALGKTGWMGMNQYHFGL